MPKGRRLCELAIGLRAEHSADRQIRLDPIRSYIREKGFPVSIGMKLFEPASAGYVQCGHKLVR
jgi:hypothetical protein